jgi:NAD(P)-dependent dehydrogenase (short-subunit alcohol dehydrogenase family)
MRDMNGRRVLLTGAAGGIGSATARRLAAHGARLALVDVDGDPLEALGADLGDAAATYRVDITDLTALERVVSDASSRWGGLDVVIANAGMDLIGPLAELSPAAFDRCIEVNVLGTWRTIRAALPAMRGPDGYVLVVSSGGVFLPPPFQGPYTASKAAMGALADTLRIELRESGTRVGVIYFGAVDTEHARRSINDPLMQRAIRRVPKSFLSYAPAAGAAEAIERAILRRARSAVFPRSNAPMMHLPGVAKRAMERWFNSA